METALFTIMEGYCPTHDLKMEITALDGTERFHRDYRFSSVPEERKSTWNGTSDNTIGTIQYTCPEGCVHNVWVNRFGDWTL